MNIEEVQFVKRIRVLEAVRRGEVVRIIPTFLVDEGGAFLKCSLRSEKVNYGGFRIVSGPLEKLHQVAIMPYEVYSLTDRIVRVLAHDTPNEIVFEDEIGGTFTFPLLP